MPGIEELQTPALLVRLDRVRHNVTEMLRRAEAAGGADRWRPHVKTSKIPEVWRLLLDAGVRHFKCATTREAAVLLRCADAADAVIDLQVAFAHRGPNLRRLAAIAKAHPRHAVSVLTEDAAHAADVRDGSARLGLHVDISPDWHRSGIPLEQEERIHAAANACGDALRGLHFYEGHVRDDDAEERRVRCHALFDRFLMLVERVEAAAGRPLELVTSGTPSFEAGLSYPGFAGREHRVGPGTIVMNDLRSDTFGLTGFQHAATVLATVVSAPTASRVTVDAGSKAVDAACGPPCAKVVGWRALRPGSPSEEHMPLVADDGVTPAPGSRVELVPMHVCPTVNLADRAVLLEGDEIVGIVPVAARGHECDEGLPTN